MADKEAILASLREQLDTTRAAIEAVLGNGQARDTNGRSVTRADLRTLEARERRLLARIARVRRGGIRVRRVSFQ